MLAKILTIVGVVMLMGTGCGDESSKSDDAGTNAQQDATSNNNGNDSGVDSGTSQTSACPASYFTNTGCTSFTDKTQESVVTISFGVNNAHVYSPKCVKIKKGSTVKFSGTFASHPLRANCQAATTITNTGTGSNKDFVFNTVGDYGYYCNFHGSASDGTAMAGMIQVVE